MKFYAIHEGFYEGVQMRIEQLNSACEKLNVEFIVLNSLTIDYSNLPQLTKADLLYNATRGSETLETLLLNDEVTTFYINNPTFVVSNNDTTKYSIIHEKANLPAPKTIFYLTSNRELLRKYIKHLGGFPVIIKVVGGSRGIGTIKIDSWPGLLSTVDYLTTTNDKFILREFIDASGVGRCKVLGNEVIQSYEFPLIEDDFRTSSIPFEHLKPVIGKEYTKEIHKLCIGAAHLANVEFASVDIIIDSKNLPYILEINFPSGLPLDWEKSGNMIALKMIDFLKRKALGNKN